MLPGPRDLAITLKSSRAASWKPPAARGPPGAQENELPAHRVHYSQHAGKVGIVRSPQHARLVAAPAADGQEGGKGEPPPPNRKAARKAPAFVLRAGVRERHPLFGRGFRYNYWNFPDFSATSPGPASQIPLAPEDFRGGIAAY
jgi:hypothetical protein